MGDYKCEICGERFKTNQARSSHKHYKHLGGKEGESDSRALDLKEDFKKILRDLGVKRVRDVIADIFFDLDGNNLEALDSVLQKAGVTNPSKAIILMRWGQRIGKKPPEKSLVTDERRDSDIFKMHDRLMETEMRELLIQDLRTKIENKRMKKNGKTDKGYGLGEKLDAILLELRLPQRKDREQLSNMDYGARSWSRRDAGHPPSYIICENCGYYVSTAGVPLGWMFVCPRCHAEYVNDFY